LTASISYSPERLGKLGKDASPFGNGALVDPRDWTCGFISRADVADFLVKQIDNGAFLHKTPVLTS
jgi:hypothetical protein